MMNNYFQRFITALAIILVFIVLSGAVFFINLITPMSSVEKWQEIKIPEGATYSQGINILKNEGIIQSSLPLIIVGRLTMKDRSLKPGFYNFSASMTPLQIFDKLIKGKSIYYTITIPEGSALEDIKPKLQKPGLVNEQTWKLVFDRNFLASLDIHAPSLEGYLYPDTYNFPKGIEPVTIFKIMVQRLREKFDQPLIERAKETGMTENEVLTLASIIEKEAVKDDERPVISAVYHNRLEKNMRLQADPTVIYGVHTYLRFITKEDLRRKTPYNTYLIYGLPPGPIASPGLKSILAAIYPAKSGYFYFVSKNDGTHHFSRTWEEHAKAVTFYQQSSNNEEEKKD